MTKSEAESYLKLVGIAMDEGICPLEEHTLAVKLWQEFFLDKEKPFWWRMSPSEKLK